MKTLADYIRPGLRLLSVGANPSIPSIAQGFYFANPRNRFWPAMIASGLHPEPSLIGERAHRYLLEVGIGFTDLVKRPTAGVHALRSADYREGTQRLRQKLSTYQPEVVWFHGKVAYRQFLKASGVDVGELEWGEQAFVDDSRVFLTPNPSPANAVYSLSDLVNWYRAVKDYAAL